MAARHLDRPRDISLRNGRWTPSGADTQEVTGESDQDPTDLWSLPHDVVVASPTTDTLVAAWAGALGPDNQDGMPPWGEPLLDRPADSDVGKLDAPPQYSARRTLHGLLMTVLVSTTVSGVVGAVAFLLIGVLTADAGAGGQVGSSYGSSTFDDRVVVHAPSDGCLMKLVKLRQDGTTADDNGTCFSVG